MTANTTPAPEPKVEHTPGPWRIVPAFVEEDGSVYPRHIVGGPREIQICQLSSLPGPDDLLIASAPTLKRERDELVEAFVGSDPTWPKDIQPLGWLKTLLIMCRESEAFKVLAGDDPDAMFECLREVQWIVDHAEPVIDRIETSDG